MKKLVVISMEQVAVTQYIKYFRSFFDNRIAVEGYYYQNNPAFPQKIFGDLVLLTSQELTAKVRERINTEAQIIYTERTLFKSQASRIKKQGLTGRIMLIDYSEGTATRMTSLLTQYGVRDIELVPVGRDTPPEVVDRLIQEGVNTAITASLSGLITQELDQIIDVGWAPIDAKTLLEISVILDIYNETIERKLFYYMKTLITSEKNIMFSLKSTIDAKNIYKTIMEMVEYGVLVVDQAGKACNWNKNLLTALKIFPSHELTAQEVDTLLPQTIHNLINSRDVFQDRMIHFSELKQNLIITRLPIKIFDDAEGAMLTVKEIPGITRRNAHIRRQMQRTIYRAKYTFDDIIGDSEKMQKSKRLASRIAAVDATVLITGESGTGKELFAQSIHNASIRSDMPFVAINCAAISPSLLESELFGYEGGAFTGARSEGHIGVFELAHKGTLFLDEVGELTLDVQAKLLRVLEEREVRRVGGESTIPIDVRIIAATNKDLLSLCREKKFRYDLFYRLNILPLHLSPLRERRDDILLLTEHFLQEMNAGEKAVTPRLKEALRTYCWGGNGRELHNCVEYMAYLSDDVIDVEQLPEYIQNTLAADMNGQDAVFPGSNAEFWNLSKEKNHILLQLHNEPIGREELTFRLQEQGILISEYRVRHLLRELKDEGYILIHRGRGGISLTPKAVQFLGRAHTI